MSKTKFKVGDIIRGVSDNYLFTNHNMTKGEVTDISFNSIKVKILEHKHNNCIEYEFWVKSNDFELVKNQPILIYQKDNKVIALNKNTGEKGVAKCSPDDNFDFMTGAKLAFERLMTAEEPNYFNGKAICISANGCLKGNAIVGKIYEFKNGNAKSEMARCFTSGPVTSIEELNLRLSPELKFLEVVE